MTEISVKITIKDRKFLVFLGTSDARQSFCRPDDDDGDGFDDIDDDDIGDDDDDDDWRHLSASSAI